MIDFTKLTPAEMHTLIYKNSKLSMSQKDLELENGVANEMINRLNNLSFDPSKMDYHVELSEELGFYSGNQLYFPIACESNLHEGPDLDLVSPFLFSDERKCFLCDDCFGKELRYYDKEFGRKTMY